jgi:hypothetical protein
MKFPDIHCNYCGKWLGEFSLEVFITGYRNYLINGKSRHFCNDNCYEKYKAYINPSGDSRIQVGFITKE